MKDPTDGLALNAQANGGGEQSKNDQKCEQEKDRAPGSLGRIH